MSRDMGRGRASNILRGGKEKGYRLRVTPGKKKRSRKRKGEGHWGVGGEPF